MSYYLGIDGGGTNTRAVLLETSGRVVGVGRAGTSNNHNVGVEKATANLLAAAQAAWTMAGLHFQPAREAFLGLAGIGSKTDIARMTAAAEGANLALEGHLEVANDLHNALTGGLDNRPGIALIGGTGANCLGRDETGANFMCGAWGWLLGDQGSAYGIAFEGLRAAAKSADGRIPPTRLLHAAQAFYGAEEPGELLNRLYNTRWNPGNIAAFAPVVVHQAAEGDTAALHILEEGAKELAILVTTTSRALDFPDGPAVILLGGCITSGPPYQPMIETAILRGCPNAQIQRPALGPLHGAALNVLRRAGVTSTTPLSIPTN